MNLQINAKKRICYVLNRDTQETNIEHLSSCASNEGYDVTIVSMIDKNLLHKKKDDRRKFVCLQVINSFSNRLISFRFIISVFKFLRSNSFDIIHIDMSCWYFWILRFSSLHAKYIFHIQSYPVHDNRLRLYKRMICIFLQCIFMDRVIIQSIDQKHKWLGLKHLKRCKIVPIGVNFELFYPLSPSEKFRIRSRLNIENSHIVLIYSGTMEAMRELDRLISSMPDIIKNFPNVRLLMVGNKAHSRNLEELTENLRLQDYIAFLGEFPHEEMNALYGAGDIGISFIPINDSYDCNPPLKTLEYLACGLACVATETISNRRLIRDGQNGLLVRDNKENITKVISFLANSPDQMRFLRFNSRKSIAEYDFKRIFSNYLFPIYKEILS